MGVSRWTATTRELIPSPCAHAPRRHTGLVSAPVSASPRLRTVTLRQCEDFWAFLILESFLGFGTRSNEKTLTDSYDHSRF